MALNINLYVHGVPEGKKTWGVLEEDKQYISNLYRAEWPAKEQMLVDIINMSGKTYCFYNFIVGQNVTGFDNRPGAYFALTLRMDAYYADLQNMYKILSAAFNKMCVGKYLKADGGYCQYTVREFTSFNAELKHMEEQIVNYISEFSNINDILPLGSFKANGQQEAAKENIQECDRLTATNIVKATGKIMVSPSFPSKEMAKILANKETEMRNLQQMTSSQIAETKSKATMQIDEMRKQFEEKNSNVDRQIQRLETQLQQQQEAAKKQQKRIDELTAAVVQKEHEITRLHHKSNTGNSHAASNNGSSNIASVVVPFLNLLIVVGAVSAMFFLMPKDNTKQITQISTDLAELKEQIAGTNADTINIDTSAETEVTDGLDITKATIEIVNATYLKLGTPTKVTIKLNDQLVKNGTWTVSDPEASVEQTGDGTALITPAKQGQITIKYALNGKEAKAEFEVKQ